MFSFTYPPDFLKNKLHILNLAHSNSDNFEQAFETQYSQNIAINLIYLLSVLN